MIISNPLILRNFNFFKLWSSQVIGQAGNRMYQIALIWWLIQNSSQLTFLNRNLQEGQLVAILLILGVLPSILLIKKIGTLIDDHPTKKILILSDSLGLLLSLILFFLFQSSWASLPLIFVATFFFSLFQGFINPTLNKSIPELLPPDEIEQGVSFITATETLANFTGAMLGALLIPLIDLSGIIILNGISYLISLYCSGTLILKYKKQKCEMAPQEKKLAFFQSYPDLKKIIIGFSFVNFFSMPLMIIIPLYTKNLLMGNASTLAIFEASVWIGLLSGTFSSPYWPLKNKTLLATSIALFFFGAFLLLPSFIISRPIFALSLFLSSASLGLLNSRMMLFFQIQIKDHQKGQFFALLQGVISFIVPLSYAFFGSLSSYLSAHFICLIQAIGIITISFYYYHLSKGQRNPIPLRSPTLSEEEELVHEI